MIKWHHFHLADNRDDFSPKSVLARRKSLVCLAIVMIFISVLCLVRCLVGARSLGEKIWFRSSRSNSKWQVSDLRSPLPSHLDILLGFILKSNIKVNKFVGKCQFWSVKQQVTWMFDLISSKFAAKVEEFRRVRPSFTTSPRYHLSASLSHDSQSKSLRHGSHFHTRCSKLASLHSISVRFRFALCLMTVRQAKSPGQTNIVHRLSQTWQTHRRHSAFRMW